MVTFKDAPTGQLIEQVSSELKQVPEIKAPAWTPFVKTGVHKERQPTRTDWWHVRAAAVLRRVGVVGPIGVAKLRTTYGGKKRRGHQPAEFRKGSGNILRKILQQLEKAGLVKKMEKSIHKGRILTPKGEKLLNSVAKKIVPQRVIPEKSSSAPQVPDGKHEKKPVKKAKKPAKVAEPKVEAPKQEA
ncbi:30S ribosomal protein S19e [Candidatus Woesearchaeota archaeon]|nr:30S ribosomal protein S19e [Candidatus Woesearchaeota archaeon]